MTKADKLAIVAGQLFSTSLATVVSARVNAGLSAKLPKESVDELIETVFIAAESIIKTADKVASSEN